MMDWLLGRCASERFINDVIIDVNGSTTSLGLLFTGDFFQRVVSVLFPFRSSAHACRDWFCTAEKQDRFTLPRKFTLML